MSAARKPREPGPLEQLEALERELAAQKSLARGYLVRGDEPYFREAALRALAEAAARAGLELARHDAGDPDFKPGVDLTRPVYVSMYGEWTKKEGLSKVDPSKPGAERLVWDDAKFSYQKARDGDVYLTPLQALETTLFDFAREFPLARRGARRARG